MIPPSFATDGFQPMDLARQRRFLPRLKRPGIMIGTEGETNTGKTEFMLSCPGPGIILAVDRMFDAVLDNPNPPSWRRDDFVFKEIALSKATQQADHAAVWRDYYENLIRAINNKDAVTVGIDGDSDTWELQRLAEFKGQFTQIPSILYTVVNAARRALLARLYDSGKIIVATNKIKDEYVTLKDEQGNAVLKDGKEQRGKSGRQIKQGFDDDNYLWHIQLKHLYRAAKFNSVLKRTIPQGWGVQVLKCKSNPGLIGTELWGGDCNFATVIKLAYPQVDLKEWGL